jgi:ATP-binding cassette subfamily B protein
MVKMFQKKYALSEQGAKDLIKGVLASFLQNMSLMLPLALLLLTVSDLLEGKAPAGNAALYLAGCVVCIVLIMLATRFQYGATYYATYVESGVRRIALAERLRKLPLSFFDKKDLADLTSTIMADCSALENVSSHFIPGLLGSIASTAVIGAGLFFVNWRLALAALWVLPIAFAVVGFSHRVQKRMSEKSMNAKMACADGIQECIEAARDLKANNAEAAYLAGLDRKIKAVEKRARVAEFGLAAFVVSAGLILKLGIGTVAVVGAALLVGGELDVFTFFMFLIVASRVYDPLTGALEHLTAVIHAQANVDRMNGILGQPIQTGARALSNRGYDIVFDHVGFSYNDRETVLRDVSFTAKQGEITALVGPSGGGKTTVSRLATRFWDADKGTISIGGMDIAAIEPEALSSLCSIVFQDVVLFNNTVMENIRIGRKDASDEEALEAARLAGCDDFALRLPNGYHSEIGENGCRLSGGERQRVSIARALLKDAPIVLLDEATAFLDVENETLIQTALSRLIRDKTVVVIAHRMRTVVGADKIVVLSEGTVSEQGSPAELMESDGVFRHMVSLQGESR